MKSCLHIKCFNMHCLLKAVGTHRSRKNLDIHTWVISFIKCVSDGIQRYLKDDEIYICHHSYFSNIASVFSVMKQSFERIFIETWLKSQTENKMSGATPKKLRKKPMVVTLCIYLCSNGTLYKRSTIWI